MTWPALLEQLPPTQALLRGFQFDPPDGPQDTGAPTLRAGSVASNESPLREGFRIGNLRLMVPYEDGSELTEMPQVYLLPNAPAWFQGMTNLHGALVPVFDLAHLFGVPHADGERPMLLVLGHGEERAGVVIDGLPQRLRTLTPDKLDQAVEVDALAGCVTGVYRIGDLDWMDLRYAPLFDRLQAELAH